MATYFDTGLLMKLFVTEANSPQVIALVASLSQPLVFSDFQHAELVTALRCKAGRGEITVANADAVEARLRLEIRAGVFAWHEPVWKSIFARILLLAQAHATVTLCRTLDAMHVAVALAAGVKDFATLDQRQAKLAKLAGLNVVQPQP
jgi:predicted nucleic acid-binding protein